MLEDEALTGTTKADFTDIYTRPDPRAYFDELVGLEYQIPQRAHPVVEAVLAASERDGRPRTVLDVCCSYGINGALLRYDVDLDDVAARATDRALADLAPQRLVEADARFYAERLRRPDLRVLGLDVSQPAIDYAIGTGLLDDGWAEDLEEHDPSPELAAGIAGTGLVVSTGGVGYIGRRTFERLLGAVADPRDLWLVVFVLRVFDYADIAAALAEYGLVTEQVEGTTFVQRRFADQDERRAATADVTRRGLDPTGRESDGWYHADCYVTRPAAAATTPLPQLLTGTATG